MQPLSNAVEPAQRGALTDGAHPALAWIPLGSMVLASTAIAAGLWLTVPPEPASLRALQLALAIVAVFGAVLSSYRPASGLILSSGATLTAWVLGLTADPFVLVGFGVFAVAERHGTRRLPWWLIAGSGTLAVGAMGLNADGFQDRIRDVLLSAVVLAVSWGLGVRTRQAKLDSAARSRAEERLHIARDVHDILTHSLSAIGVRAGVAAHVNTLGEIELRETLRQVELDARGSLAELTGLLNEIRDGALDATGNAPFVPLSEVLAHLARTAEDTGLRAALVLSGPVDTLPTEISTTVHRLVQEALTNTARHAAAASVHITITVQSNRVDVRVSDDGAGTAAGLRPGHGLTGMRERVDLIGGSLTLDGGPPGFTVSARMPLPDDVTDRHAT
jgi:signal transduction histidine kinase